MTKFVDSLGLKRLVTKIAEAVSNGTWLPVRKGEGEGSVVMGTNSQARGDNSHAEGDGSSANGYASHAEGQFTIASGDLSHAEGFNTKAYGKASHAQGSYNYADPSFIDTVGVGNNNSHATNASVIYVGRDESKEVDPSDPKNGYQYLIGIGGYQGRNIAEGMKSVQEVIADLEKGVAATETMTVEEIREIMSA